MEIDGLGGRFEQSGPVTVSVVLLSACLCMQKRVIILSQRRNISSHLLTRKIIGLPFEFWGRYGRFNVKFHLKSDGI